MKIQRQGKISRIINLPPRNIINKQDIGNQVKSINGNIYLKYNGDHFKCIDVPCDGDCFYHSVLKCISVSDRIHSVQELRFYLRDMVHYLIPNDLVLQRIFSHEQINHAQWCQRITIMGEWANTLDTFIFSYLMKINVIGIGNYLGRFHENNMHVYAQQLRLPSTFPDKPAIHVYFHKYGHALEMNASGDYFCLFGTNLGN